MRVGVIDYGIGNVQSVVNACEALQVETRRVTSGADLEAFDPDRIILPGVGAIGAALDRFRSAGFVEPAVRMVREQRRPFLGICVGMQMLAEVCEEFGEHRGLGWIPGRVVRLAPADNHLRIPHIGWNTVMVADPDDPVIGPLDGRDVYFVHSYAMTCPDSYIAGRCDYGGNFTCAVRRDNIYGVQFHPEKSSRDGSELLRRFMGAPHV